MSIFRSSNPLDFNMVEILPYQSAALENPMSNDLGLQIVFPARIHARSQVAVGGELAIRFLVYSVAARGMKADRKSVV